MAERQKPKKLSSEEARRWGAHVAGLMILTMGSVSLFFTGHSSAPMYANLLQADDVAQVGGSSAVDVYDLAPHNGLSVRTGDFKPMFALDFRTSAPQFTSFKVELTSEQAPDVFTDGTGESKFLKDASVEGSDSNIVAILDANNNNIIDDQDPIFVSAMTANYDVTGNTAESEFFIPISMPVSNEKTVFIGINTKEYGHDYMSDGMDLQMTLTEVRLGVSNDVLDENVEGSTIFLDIFEPRIHKTNFLDLGDAGMGSGDKISFIADQSMDAPSGLNPEDLFEFATVNSDAGNGTFGTGSSYVVSETHAPNDTVTVTLGTSPNITNNHRIWPLYPSELGGVIPHPVILDFDEPGVNNVYLEDSDGDGAYESPGDMLFIEFSSGIDPTTFDQTSLGVSSGDLGTFIHYWLGNNLVLELVQDNIGNDVVGSTMSFSTDIEGENGIPMPSGTTKTILGEPTVTRAYGLQKLGSHAVDLEINEDDLQFQWSYDPANITENLWADILLLPAGTAPSLDARTHQPLNLDSSIQIQGNHSSGTVIFDGRQHLESNFGLNWDSNSKLIGYEQGIYNFLEPHREYEFHVLTCDAGRVLGAINGANPGDNEEGEGGGPGGGEGGGPGEGGPGGGPSRDPHIAEYHPNFMGEGRAALQFFAEDADLDFTLSVEECPGDMSGDCLQNDLLNTIIFAENATPMQSLLVFPVDEENDSAHLNFAGLDAFNLDIIDSDPETHEVTFPTGMFGLSEPYGFSIYVDNNGPADDYARYTAEDDDFGGDSTVVLEFSDGMLDFELGGEPCPEPMNEQTCLQDEFNDHIVFAENASPDRTFLGAILEEGESMGDSDTMTLLFDGANAYSSFDDNDGTREITVNGGMLGLHESQSFEYSLKNAETGGDGPGDGEEGEGGGPGEEPGEGGGPGEGGPGGGPGEGELSETRECTISSSAPFEFETAIGENSSIMLDMETAFPAYGMDVGKNLKHVIVKFNQTLERGSVDSDNVRLRKEGTDTYLTIDTTISGKNIIVSPDADLEEDTRYEVVISPGIESTSGAATEHEIIAAFGTKDSDFENEPEIVSTNVENGLPPEDDLFFVFSSVMLPSSFTQNAEITPSIGLTPEFYPHEQRLVLRHSGLQENTEYTLSFDRTENTGVRDVFDTIISEDDASFTFTTGSADLTVPDVEFADFKETNARVKFNVGLKESTVNANNVFISCAETGVLSLAAANFEMINGSEVEIYPLQLTAGHNCNVRLSDSLKSRAGIPADPISNEPTLTRVFSDDAGHGASVDQSQLILANDQHGSRVEEAFGGFGEFNDGEYEERADDPMAREQYPIIANPLHRIANTETSWEIGFPFRQSLQTGQKIIIEFPNGTNATNASVSPHADDPYFGSFEIGETEYEMDEGEMNVSWEFEPGTGLVGTISIDADGDEVVDAEAQTAPMGYFFTILDGIVNSPFNTEFNTSSSAPRATITVIDSTGRTTQSIGSTEPIFLKDQGSNTVTVNTPNGSFCEIWSPDYFERMRATGGQCVFSNLPRMNGHLYIHPPFNYYEQFNEDKINFTENSGGNLTFTKSFRQGSNTVSGRINYTNDTDESILLDVLAFGNQGQMVRSQVTATAGSSYTNYSIKVDDGEYNFEVMPGFDMEEEHIATDYLTEFIPPTPVYRRVTGSETVNFNIVEPVAELRGRVVDASDSPIVGAHILAIDRDGNAIHGEDSQPSGEFMIDVPSYGSYTIVASKFGRSTELAMFVNEHRQKPGTDSAKLVIQKPDYTITGYCLDGDSETTMCGVSARNTDTNEMVWGFDEGDGDGYVLPVGNGEWEVRADGEGMSSSQTTTVSGSSQSGVNFTFDSNNLGTISGLFEKDGEGLEGAHVCVDEFYTSNREFTGVGNCTSTDSTGAFSINTQKNGNDTRYTIFVDHFEYGSYDLDKNIDIRSGNHHEEFTNDNLHALTFEITGATDIDEGFINLSNGSNFVGFPVNEVEDGSYTMYVKEGTYHLSADFKGIGHAFSDEYGVNEFVINSATNVTFDLDIEMIEVDVTVRDDKGAVIENADVILSGPSGVFIEATDSSGEVTIDAPAGESYKLFARSNSHTSPRSTQSVSSTDSYNVTLVGVEEAIEGTVVNGDSEIVAGAFVSAECSDNSSTDAITNDAGAFKLGVADGVTCDVTSHIPGFVGEVNDVTPGGSAITVTSNIEDVRRTFEPHNESVSVNNGGRLSVADAGLELVIGSAALGTGSGDAQIVAAPAAPIDTKNSKALSTVELTAVNSDGTAITDFNDDINLRLKLEKDTASGKDEIADLVDANIMEISDISEIKNAYYSPTSKEWVTLSTTLSCEYKLTSGADDTDVDCGELETLIEENPSIYTYSITAVSPVDHFTSFGNIIEGDGGGSSGGNGGATSASTNDDGSNAEESSEESSGSSSEESTSESSGEESIEETPGETEAVEEEIPTEDEFTIVDEEEGTVTELVKPLGTDPVDHLEDINEHWGKAFIEVLVSSGLAQGNGENFRPDDPITRAEISKILVNALELPRPIKVFALPLDEFKDVNPADWSAPYVFALHNAGFLNGNDGLFRPHDEANRAEALRLILNSAEADLSLAAGYALSFEDVPRNAWFRSDVRYATKFGIIGGYEDGRLFKPGENITRAEFSKITVKQFLPDQYARVLAEHEETMQARKEAVEDVLEAMLEELAVQAM